MKPTLHTGAALECVFVSYLAWWPSGLRGLLRSIASEDEDVFIGSKDQEMKLYLQRPFVSRPLQENEVAEVESALWAADLRSPELGGFSVWHPRLSGSTSFKVSEQITAALEFFDARDSHADWNSLQFFNYPRFIAAMRYKGEGFPPGDACLIDKHSRKVIEWRYIDVSLMVRSETKMVRDRVLFRTLTG